ncbi:hypothetical protein [Novipirellula artificiosorum]|uniref:PEP-CTERM protein-sorting domain-containing protein n=1 Tax=Novipirellula artificiosorum TaxID=2528016 RepID=A0A5C6D2B4_9BACT|nr:hypothetical protein [Novipirellula artificiosorum]TWU28999.1 hypothetical protein Poly41_67900 [Novipirellula artificiosorum]
MKPRRSRWSFLIAIAVLACMAPTASAGLMNGDFSDATGSPFAAWTTDPFFNAAPTDGGGFARFQVTDFLIDPSDLSSPLDEVQLQQTFVVPNDATTLSFEFLFSSAAGGSSDPFAAFDAFQATLYDSLFDPINPIDPFLPGFYSFDSSGFEDKAAGVTVENLPGGMRRVSLDISSLGLQEVTIDFQLLGDDDELISTVDLDNVIVSQESGVVPEPISIAIWAVTGVAALPFCRRRRRPGM